jgi:diguanylate cyclase (GGDEF)-like protein
VFSSTQGSRIIAAGILLTLAALLGREYLPQRTLDLLAPSDRRHFLAAPGPGIEWIDEAHYHLRCHYTDTGGYQACGVTFLLTQDSQARGTDLRTFSSMVVDVAYRGNGDFVRVGMRNFDPRFSREQDGNSARMQSTNIRVDDLKRPLTIALNELDVPEWWIAQFRLPREYNRQSFENVTAIGVLNRRGVEQALADLGERAGSGIALVMVDIDHFKRINDTQGHAAGDQVLQRVAAVMIQSVRADDIVGRWGGEEFIVACVHCTAGHAAQVAEKIRQRIEATPFGARQRIHVTASFGVAAMGSTAGFAETLRRADEALYRAKSEGRNRVVVDVAEG